MFRFSILTLALSVLIFGSVFAQEQNEAGVTPDADRLYYDAIKAHILGDNKQSEVLLKQVIDRNPNESAPYYELAKMASKSGNAAKAGEYIRNAIARDGDNKWYHEEYANILALQNDFSAAADEYAAIAKKERFNENELDKSALLYQRAGKYKEALGILQLLKKNNNDDNEVLLQEQQIYLKMNDVAGAAKVSRELIDKNPREPRYYTLLIEIYENNKMPDKAKEAVAEMKQKFPTDPALQLNLAYQALKTGDTATYRRYVRKTIINKEVDAQTQLQLLAPYLGALASDSVQRTEALELIENIAQQHPDNPDVIMAYARILNFNKKESLAAIQYRKAIALNPNSFSAWEQLLYSMTAKEDADSLIKWSNKAARSFPNQALVYYLNGIGYYNKKEYKSAVRSLSRALDLEPDEKDEEKSQIFTTLGDIYNIQKDYSLSDSSYESALRLNPRNATVLNNYAYYLSVRNTRLDEAAKMSKRSLEIRPGESTFFDTYGWILYQQGKYKEALSYIQKAVAQKADEHDPVVWEHLGAALYKNGDKQGAVAAWKRAKEKGSDNRNIDKMISDEQLYE